MAESLRQNEQVDNLPIVDQNLNPISFKFKETLDRLKKDKWVERKKDTSDGKKVFDYTDKTQQKWEIVIGKEKDNTYTVQVKKWVYFSNLWRYDWETQKNWNEKTFLITAETEKKFNAELWKVLNGKIWEKNRDKLPNTWKKVYEDLNKVTTVTQQAQEPSKEQKEQKNEKTNLKAKPIDLKYTEINKEKKLEPKPNYPKNERSVEWRITRCLRFKSITDAVEDRYWIPRWLLMAMMAQEWWWDPTVVNLNGDWWAGLIHIQAINAADYWMKTLPRYKNHNSKNNQVDYQHWKELKKLSALDDRFNPVLGIDVAARFLLWDKWWKNASTWDEWMKSVLKYAGRWMSDYGYSVLVYRTTINKVRWNIMPTFKDKEINKVIKWEVSALTNSNRERTDLCIARTKEALNNLNPFIDWESVSLDEYYRYLEWQRDNYWLAKYKKYAKEHPYVK